MSQTKSQLIEGSAASELTAAKTLLGAGSAGAPSLTATGDTNTGIFFPTADTLAASTAGSERLRITSAGLVGINTASPQLSFVCSNGGANGFEIDPTQSTGTITGINSYNRSSSAFTPLRFNASEHRWDTASTERARIDSSGRLLIGTSTDRSASYGSLAQVYATDSTASFTLRRGSANSGAAIFNFFKTRGNAAEIVSNGDVLGNIYFQGADGTNIVAAAAITAEVDGTPGTNDMPGRLLFATTADGASSPTERMKIDSTGRLISQNVTGTNLTCVNNGGSGTALLYFQTSSVELGKIVSNGSNAVTYATSSDYRLKENIVPLSNGINRLRNLRPYRFNFLNTPDSTVDGFVAHEAQAVVPECATGIKDEVDADGNPVYQGIDQSKLVPLLTAALQELVAEVESLKAEVAALKAP
jgi:hypothetical protein